MRNLNEYIVAIAPSVKHVLVSAAAVYGRAAVVATIAHLPFVQSERQRFSVYVGRRIPGWGLRFRRSQK